jgi:predicted transcriptional regulator YdeE
MRAIMGPSNQTWLDRRVCKALPRPFWDFGFSEESMEPRIVFHDAFVVMGIQEPVNNDDPKFYHTLWMERYMPYDEQVKALSTDKAYYSIYFALDKQEYCLDGMAVASATVAGGVNAEGLVSHRVEAGSYATFDCTVKTIGQTWQHIFRQWLPQSSFEVPPDAASFEFYPPNTETDDSSVIIYLPITEKAS